MASGSRMIERLQRLAASPWWAAVCLLLIVVAIGLMWRQRPNSSATLCCHVRSPGMVVQGHDGEVLVYAAGENRVVARGELGEDLQVAPGRYDARVVFLRLSTDRSRWFRDIPLDAGRRVVKEADYSAGELSVTAHVGSGGMAGGKVVVYVFRPNDHDTVITTMPASESVFLPADRYDLRAVLTVDSAEKDVRWLHDSQVHKGRRTEHAVSFQRGSVFVRAKNGQDELPRGAVRLTVTAEDDVQEQVIESGFAGEPVALPVGRYDIKAVFATSHDKPVRWIRALEIVDGKSEELDLSFSSGGIVIEARMEEGEVLEPFAAYVYYYRPGDHQQPVAYTPAGEHAVLESGLYDVRTEFYRAHDRPDVWLRDVQVTTGEVTTETVHFRSGTLLVRAHDNKGHELVGCSGLTLFAWSRRSGRRG